MAAIELVDIRKTYPGGAQVVHGINLSIADGELVVLVGPSGCGKSTLLRMIAGLETVTEGTISIGGNNVNNVEPAERDIAMVFQNYALYPHMTVRGNLEYGLKNRNTPRSLIDERVTEAARMLEITPFLDRKPRQLSGGQRQRVAMGRALVRQPKAFLFDEPLSNLDAKLRGQMRIEIKGLQRTLRTTSVYVTHDQLEAMTLADRLVVMNAGRIEQVGTPIELYAKPATVFVAGFIGSPPMNFIDMSAFDETTRSQLADSARGADLVGIRPDALSFTAPSVPSVALTGTIELIEPIGAECHIHLRWNNQRLVAEYRGVPPFAEGVQQPFFLDMAAMHFFDKASGQRR